MKSYSFAGAGALVAVLMISLLGAGCDYSSGGYAAVWPGPTCPSIDGTVEPGEEGVVLQTTLSSGEDMEVSPECFGITYSGADAQYSIAMERNDEVVIRTQAVAELDAAIYILKEACVNPGIAFQCIASADAYGEGMGETLVFKAKSTGSYVIVVDTTDRSADGETVPLSVEPLDWDRDYEREVGEEPPSVLDEAITQELHFDLKPSLFNLACGDDIRDIHLERFSDDYDLLYIATDLGLCVMNSQFKGTFFPVHTGTLPPGGFISVSAFTTGAHVAAGLNSIHIEEALAEAWVVYDMPADTGNILTIKAQGESTLYIGTTVGLYILDTANLAAEAQPVAELDGKICRAVEFFGDDTTYVATAEGLYVKSGANAFALYDDEDLPDTDVLTVKARWLPEAQLWVGTSSGVLVIPASGTAFVLDDSQPTGNGYDALPRLDARAFNFDEDGVIWMGFAKGAARWDAEDGWHYYQSERWLPNDDARVIAGRNRVATYIATPAGISYIYTTEMTLEQKAKNITDIVKLRHDRHGMVADSHLENKGDVSSNFMWDTDNDGLWTSIWVGAEAFRYAATGDTDALGNARKSMHAMLFLEEVNGIDGFISRSIVKTSEREKPDYGEWHLSKDKVWWWKGDTSPDEMDGHFFAWDVYWDLCADEYDKAKIRDTVKRVMDYLIENNYELIDVDGKSTKWGHWSPDYLESEGLLGASGLRALEMITYLTVAYKIVEDPRYLAAKYDLILNHGYLDYFLHQQDMTSGRFENHSDDEMAYMMYYVLGHNETDPYILNVLDDSLIYSFVLQQPEQSSLFNFVYGSIFKKEFDFDGAMFHLRNYPHDLVRWTADNSGRTDLMQIEFNTLFNSSYTHEAWLIKKNGTVLPVDERPMIKWNGNPYSVVGGYDGMLEEDGTAYLLPYWMGRYYGFITVPEVEEPVDEEPAE